MAQEFGAKRYESLKDVIGTSTILSALSAAVFLLAGQFLARPVLQLLQTPVEILDNALLYLRYMFFGVPIVMAYNLFACILRALGDGKTPLHAWLSPVLPMLRLTCCLSWYFTGESPALQLLR